MLDLDDDEDEDFKMVPPYKKPPTSRIDRKVYHTAGIVPVLQDGSGGDMFTARADTFFKTFYQEAHQVEAEDEVPATKRQTIREEKTQEIKPKFLFDNLDFRPTILSVAANFSGAPTNKTHSESPVIPLTMDVVIISDDQEELITKRKGLRRRNKKQIDLGSDDCTLIENTSSIDLKSLEKKDSNSIKIPNKSSIHLTTRKDPHDEGTFVSVTLYPTLNAIQLGVQSELLSMVNEPTHRYDLYSNI